MKITYDIDVICPSCSAKAQFTFTFRRIFEEHITQVRKFYPGAIFTEISPQFRQGVIVSEFFGSKGIRIGPETRCWLMNLYPAHFDLQKDMNYVVGLIKCLKCGMIRKSTLSDELYFYKVNVDGRYLLAKKCGNLIYLRNFFASEKRPYISPDEDFPKSFYLHSNLIVQEIDKLLDADGKNS